MDVVSRSVARGALAWAIVGVTALSACGPNVQLLSIQDRRLPLEARKWIADAEDAVSVAQSYVDEAQANLRQAEKEAARLKKQANRLAESGGSGPSMQLVEVAKARVRLAELRLEQAEAELALARAKQDQVNAETAMRHDIEVYDLEPIREATEEARKRTKGLSKAIIAARDRMEQLTASWWQTYTQWLGSGGKREVIWLLDPADRQPRPARKPKPKPEAQTPPAGGEAKPAGESK